MSEDRAIGKDGKLLWYIKADMNHFKQSTLNGHVIFGRKTFDGLPRKWLPNRTLWILTRKNTFGWTNGGSGSLSFPAFVNIVESIDELPKEFDYWVCGGKEIYTLFMDKLDEVVCTHVKGTFPDADAFMPPFEHLFPHTKVIATEAEYGITRYSKQEIKD